MIPRYNFDYSKVIDKNQKDLDVYNRKFELYEEAIKDKNWAFTDKILLLEDPTIYIYSMFGIKHRWYQDMIISDDYRFKIFCASNQIGKSFLLNTGAIFTFLKDHGHGYNRAIISKSLPQARYQMARIKNMLKKTKIDWKEDKGDTDNIMIISLNIKQDKKYKYTNYLICAPCTEGALGYDLHEMDLDEFDFYDVDQEQFFTQVAQPRTYATKGKINIYSNPNGRERYMFELWNQKLPDNSYKWHRYQFNYWDSPNSSEKEFELLTSGLSRRRIESTLLAVFTTAEGSYFSYDDIIKSEDLNLNSSSAYGKQTFFFLDPGSSVDHSVLTGCYLDTDTDNVTHVYEFLIHEYPLGYPMYRVVGIHTDEQDQDGWHYEKSVKDYLEEYNLNGFMPIFDCDVTKNDSLTYLFQKAKVFPQNVIVFSGPKKYNYYENLNYMMQRRPILFHRIKNNKFVEQAMNLEIKGRASGGYLMLHAAKDTVHDDIIDSTVACVYLATNASIHPGLTVIDSKGRVVNSESDDVKQEVKSIVELNKEELNSKITLRKIGNVIETRNEYINKNRRNRRW